MKIRGNDGAVSDCVKIARNAFIVGGFITFIYIIFHFFSGNYIGDRLEGTWRAVCIQEEITFEGNSFVRGREAGEFRVRANLIYFGAHCNGYPIRLTTQYLWLNGVYYLRTTSENLLFCPIEPLQTA